MLKFIRFRPVQGKLEAEAMGFTGPSCQTAMRETVQAMGLKIEPGSEKLKPEFMTEGAKVTADVSH